MTGTDNTSPTDRRAAGLAAGRRADSDRRRHRVIKAINAATAAGDEISVSAIARRAAVDRSFLYRHRDLLAQIHTAAEHPTVSASGAPAVSRASLRADLANCHERCQRLARQVRELEERLSEVLGESVWRATGLGAPDDVEKLNNRVVQLEQQLADAHLTLDDREAELAAARAANRELIAQLNIRPS